MSKLKTKKLNTSKRTRTCQYLWKVKRSLMNSFHTPEATTRDGLPGNRPRAPLMPDRRRIASPRRRTGSIHDFSSRVVSRKTPDTFTAWCVRACVPACLRPCVRAAVARGTRYTRARAAGINSLCRCWQRETWSSGHCHRISIPDPSEWASERARNPSDMMIV